MNYSFSSEVLHGNKRGKALGFPTANQKLEKEIEEGIYLSNAIIDNTKYNALTFIGKAHTFNEEVYQAETYILDFDKDIYGEILSVTLLKKLRGNQKFESVEKLVAQMEKDKKEAIEFFKTSS